MKTDSLRLVLLHCAPRFDNDDANIAMLEALISQAAELGPDLIITPELAVSGYGFAQAIGTAWIAEQMPGIVARVADLTQVHRTAILLSTPRHDADTDQLHNAAFFIDAQGDVIGQHDKLSVLPGSESWATPGKTVHTVSWNGLKIGLLICADVYPPGPAQALTEQGIDLLISPAAWGPGMHEPAGEWEARSAEIGRPVIVCNRTGPDRIMNFEGSASIVAVDGQRLLSYKGQAPAILSFDLSTQQWCPQPEQFEIHHVKTD